MSLPLMRAAVCPAPGRLALESLPVPQPGPGEARVRISACGICGSDLHLLPVGYLGRCVVPGHEMGGEIDLLGDGVENLATGDRVAVEPLRSCGRCGPCRRGAHALCPDLSIFGVHENGGFAEYAVLPAQRLYPVDPALPVRIAALAEPMAVVVHGVRRGGVGQGSRVLVLGAGTLGLLGTLCARALGAQVWVTARYPHQVELARQLGATRVLGEAEATPEALDALGREVDFDCVLESVGGGADTLALGVRALGPGGTLCVLGLFQRPIQLDPAPLFVKEATLAWSNCYQQSAGDADFSEAIRLIEAHRDRLGELTTHRVALDEVERGFALAGDRRAGAVKVSVVL